MPRTSIEGIVQDTAGNALVGASCQVNKREGGAATVYSAETGATTLPNPITTDAAGRITGWLEGGSFDIAITPAIGTPYTERYESNSGRNDPLVPPAAFPTTPTDGEVVSVQVVEGVTWDFKYNAGSASPYKWEFNGGPPLMTEKPDTGLTVSLSNATYTNLSTGVMATITAPYAGEYIVELGSRISIDGGGALMGGLMSYSIGATAASEDDSVQLQAPGFVVATVHRSRPKTFASANTAIVGKFRRSGANPAFFNDSFISILPKRVTG